MDETTTPTANEGGAPDAEASAALRYLFHPTLSRTHTRPAYRELPPQSEMKVGRVAAIYDRGRLLPHLARLINAHGLGRFEKGCYVIVPVDFPNECDVHVTDQGVHAFAKVGEEYRTFVIRPAATTEGAWENYELQRGWTKEYPEDIGRACDPRRAAAHTAESAALATEYDSAAARPGVTTVETPERFGFVLADAAGERGLTISQPIPARVFTPPRALAVYHRPPSEEADPLHLKAIMGFAVRLCSGRRAYVAVFLPEGAEGEIPALLELAKGLNPDARTSDAEKVFDGGYHVTVGVMTEENARDYDSGRDHITLVTRAGRGALLASGRPSLDLLFSAAVAAPGAFADDAEARDLLTRHFNGAHLVLVWTDSPPPADAPAADYHLAGTIVTYDARHLPASAPDGASGWRVIADTEELRGLRGRVIEFSVAGGEIHAGLLPDAEPQAGDEGAEFPVTLALTRPGQSSGTYVVEPLHVRRGLRVRAVPADEAGALRLSYDTPNPFATPNHLLAYMKADLAESKRLTDAHEAGGPRAPAVEAFRRAERSIGALYERIRDLTEAGHAVYLRGRWRDGEPLVVRSLGTRRNESSIHFDDDPGARFFPHICDLRAVESIEVVDEEPVRRALAHPWVASRVEALLAEVTGDESLHAALREDLLGFFTAAARAAMLIRLAEHPEPFFDGTDVHDFFVTGERARWVDVEVPRLHFALCPPKPELRAHSAAVMEARARLAQLAYILVTLARVRPGELPAPQGLETKPLLRLAQEVLLNFPALAGAPTPDPDGKPEGRFRCRACASEWEGRRLIRSPYHAETTWLCGDACCGALVDKITTA